MAQHSAVNSRETESPSVGHRPQLLSFSWRGTLQFKAGSPPKSILEWSDWYLIRGMRESHRIIIKDQKLLTYWKMLILNTLISWSYTLWLLEISSNQYHHSYILRPPEMLKGKHWKNQHTIFLGHQTVFWVVPQVSPRDVTSKTRRTGSVHPWRMVL